MGGRGSGGGRGGGGAAKKVPTGEGITDKNELINLYNSISGNSNLSVEQRVKAMHDIQERIKELDAKKASDLRAIVNTKNQMNNETVKLALEQNKLRKMNEEFRKVNMSDKDYESKSLALEKQISKVSEAQSRADIRTQIHYLAINEKYNVRDKQATNNIKSMTNSKYSYGVWQTY